jgi:hypothetical protein
MVGIQTVKSCARHRVNLSVYIYIYVCIHPVILIKIRVYFDIPSTSKGSKKYVGRSSYRCTFQGDNDSIAI